MLVSEVVQLASKVKHYKNLIVIPLYGIRGL